MLPLDKHQDIRHLAQVRPSYDETQSVSEEAEDEFCIGDKVRLVQDGVNDEVTITEIEHDFATTVDHYTAEFLGGHSLVTTKDFFPI